MIISKIKKMSYILAPLLVTIVCVILQNLKFNIFNQTMYNKVDTLASISGSIATILVAVLTIYISLPNNDKIKKLKKTEHTKIFINNITVGILLFIFNIILWLLNVPNFWSVVVFLDALSNLFITIYYIVVISKNI